MRKTFAILAVNAFLAGGASAATLEIDGPVTMSADLSNSPTDAIAIGALSRAEAGVGVIEGDVKIKGGVTMTASLKNSPTSAIAIGAGAVAKARVNAIDGKK